MLTALSLSYYLYWLFPYPKYSVKPQIVSQPLFQKLKLCENYVRNKLDERFWLMKSLLQSSSIISSREKFYDNNDNESNPVLVISFLRIPRNRVVRNSGLPLLSPLYQPQQKDNYLDLATGMATWFEQSLRRLTTNMSSAYI